MIIGSNHDAPVRELLNNNPKERKVVDLCAGTGRWYVVHHPRSPTPVLAASAMCWLQDCADTDDLAGSWRWPASTHLLNSVDLILVRAGLSMYGV
jgi:hypothetical protein